MAGTVVKTSIWFSMFSSDSSWAWLQGPKAWPRAIWKNAFWWVKHHRRICVTKQFARTMDEQHVPETNKSGTTTNKTESISLTGFGNQLDFLQAQHWSNIGEKFTVWSPPADLGRKGQVPQELPRTAVGGGVQGLPVRFGQRLQGLREAGQRARQRALNFGGLLVVIFVLQLNSILFFWDVLDILTNMMSVWTKQRHFKLCVLKVVTQWPIANIATSEDLRLLVRYLKVWMWFWLCWKKSSFSLQSPWMFGKARTSICLCIKTAWQQENSKFVGEVSIRYRIWHRI